MQRTVIYRFSYMGKMVNNETYMTLLKSRILQTEMKFFF